LVSAAAGGVGALAVQIAKLQGATVIGLASRAKHDFVRKNGADHVFDYRSWGWSSSVREVVGDRGVDLFLDSIGDLQTEAAGVLGAGAHWTSSSKDARPWGRSSSSRSEVVIAGWSG